MRSSFLVAVGLLGAIGLGAELAPAIAQTTTTPATTPPAPTSTGQPVRNPNLGDAGSSNAPVTKPPSSTARAHARAAADKQPPGVENGNQPDRAGAAAGAR